MRHFRDRRVSDLIGGIRTQTLQAAAAVVVEGHQRRRNSDDVGLGPEFERHDKFRSLGAQFPAVERLLLADQLRAGIRLQLGAKLEDVDLQFSFDLRPLKDLDDGPRRRRQELVGLDDDRGGGVSGSKITVSLKISGHFYFSN